jgi:hypothetical protein
MTIKATAPVVSQHVTVILFIISTYTELHNWSLQKGDQNLAASVQAAENDCICLQECLTA